MTLAGYYNGCFVSYIDALNSAVIEKLKDTKFAYEFGKAGGTALGVRTKISYRADACGNPDLLGQLSKAECEKGIKAFAGSVNEDVVRGCVETFKPSFLKSDSCLESASGKSSVEGEVQGAADKKPSADTNSNAKIRVQKSSNNEANKTH